MIWLLALCGFIIGILINLCADGLPIKRRLQRPVCPQCDQPRPFLAWSGILAWASRQRRCPNCATPLPWRHPLVELGAIGLFALCGLRGEPPFVLITQLVYGSIFILVLVTDLEHKLIPHLIMLPAIALAILATLLNPGSDYPARGLLGGGIGLISALGLYWFGKLFVKLVGRVRGRAVSQIAFGFGDVTLITFIGFAVGAPDIIFALVIGILSGGIISALYVSIFGLLLRKYSAFTAIPYGPFLILGGSVMLYFGRAFMAWYSMR